MHLIIAKLAVAAAALVITTPYHHYVVLPGDTLSSVSQLVYGRAADWPELWRLNLAEVPDPDMLYVGEVLTVPAIVASSPQSPVTATGTLSGTLGCAGLEKLWEQAGGAQAEAFTAAEIAMAESGGSQYATGAAGERGYWQIHPDHGSLSTYAPLGNARAAVLISADGTNWTPWTTYTSGLYIGRC
jgi:hypothetical protein